jgi:energy-coupling factor transporter transmembrane protein EcfT
MNINRFQAFGIHLVGSVVVALSSAALVFLLWYPSPLAVATGVTTIFLILLGVDVTLGPCITLIIFNPAKKPVRELRRDLTIVLLLQMAALLYGLHTVFVARPVYNVYSAGRFDLVYANDLTPEKLAKVQSPEFQSPPLLGPRIVAARSPTDTKARNEILLGSLSGGDDLPQMPQYYVPYTEERDKIVGRIQPIDALRELNKAEGARIDAIAVRYASRSGGIGFLPVRGKVKDLTAIVARDTAEVLEIVELNPWP